MFINFNNIGLVCLNLLDMNTSLGPQFCRLFHWNHLSWLVQLKACIFPLLKSKKQRISCTLLNEIKLQASRSKQRSGMAK